MSVDFTLQEPQIRACVDPEEEWVVIEGVFDEPDDVAGFGIAFVYTLAALSFRDARPRGGSFPEYREKDFLTASDFLHDLEWPRGTLHWHGDYIKGRRSKTTIDLHADGRFRLETVQRGQAALRWFDRMRGKQLIAVVEE